MKDRRKLTIHLLERLEIFFDNQNVEGVLSKSRKARMLVELLILHKGEPVSVFRLYESLWGKTDIRNPESALKALVCRTRAMLMEADPALRDCIVAEIGSYHWNMGMTGDVDVFTVEKLSQTLLQAERLGLDERRVLDKLLCTYSGKLLPEFSGEDWVVRQALALESVYKKAISQALCLLRGAMDWETIVKVSRMALIAYPLELEWQEFLIRAMIRHNRRNDALNQYRQMTQQYLQQLGVQPPDRIRELYFEILRADDALEKDIDSVSRELQETESISGAFVCEYAIFKDIYQVQLRSLERYKQTVFLSMVKVNHMLGEMIDPMYLDEVMQQLLEVLRSSLRKGDTITRYTASQFALLLQGASVESVAAILDRVRDAFYDLLGNQSMVLEYRYMPLGQGTVDPPRIVEAPKIRAL